MSDTTIWMKSGTYVVDEIIKKTTAKMFKDLKVGSLIEFSVPVTYAGTSRGRTYSTYITTECLYTGEKVQHSFNQLPLLLNNFKLSEL